MLNLTNYTGPRGDYGSEDGDCQEVARMEFEGLRRMTLGYKEGQFCNTPHGLGVVQGYSVEDATVTVYCQRLDHTFEFNVEELD